jgi:hypothetical protein
MIWTWFGRLRGGTKIDIWDNDGDGVDDRVYEAWKRKKRTWLQWWKAEGDEIVITDGGIEAGRAWWRDWNGKIWRKSRNTNGEERPLLH